MTITIQSKFGPRINTRACSTITIIADANSVHRRLPKSNVFNGVNNYQKRVSS